MLRPAHGAELILLVDVNRQSLVVILLGTLRIQGQLKLLVPIEVGAGAAELVITRRGAGAEARDVSFMGSDLVSDQALSHILSVGQAAVLFRDH